MLIRNGRGWPTNRRGGSKIDNLNNVDLVDTLRRIVRLNTQHYQTDYVYDAHALLHEQIATDYFFMSRPCGTYLFDCRRVYGAGTSAHNTWRWYLEQVAGEAINDVRAYAIYVESRRGGAFGRIQELNFPYHVQDAIKFSQPFTEMEVHYMDGTTEITTDAAFHERRKRQEYPQPFWRAVPIFPDDRVQSRLADQQKHRERYGKTITPEAHIEKLRIATLRYIGYPHDNLSICTNISLNLIEWW